MSIKVKFPLFMLLIMLLNFLLIGGYYRFYLSTQISETSNEKQDELQRETDRISVSLRNSTDASSRLTEIAKSENLVIRVQDSAGKVLLQTGSEPGIRFEHHASALLPYQGQVCLLQVTQGISITNLTEFQIAGELIKTECGIIFVVLLLSGLFIYVRYAVWIVSLQRKMERYRSGIVPERTGRKDELGRLQNEFADLTDALEEEKKNQNRIIASISHDIKTPLTSVMGYAERLKKSSLSPEKREQYVDTIYRKSLVIKTLIDDFDEYLSYHTQSSLKRQFVSAEQLCGILRLDYEGELRERGVSFSIRDGCPQAGLSVDLSRIRRIFGNLIDNSLKHAGERAPEISVSCAEHEHSVLFTVEDSGTGVKEEELKNIFEPFYTSDHARTFAGLGLSICREIAEAHGGRIWAENRPEGGLRVCVSLPEAQ